MQLCPKEPCHQQHGQNVPAKQNIKVQQYDSVKVKGLGAQNSAIVINTWLLFFCTVCPRVTPGALGVHGYCCNIFVRGKFVAKNMFKFLSLSSHSQKLGTG